jgi:hypothetical protein
MTDQSPAEQLAAEIRSMQSSVDALQSDVRLSDIRDEVGDLEATVGGLAQGLRDLRARGYLFEKDLEEQAANLSQRWATMNLGIQQQINQQAPWLQMEWHSVENLMVQLRANEGNITVAQPLLAQTRAAVDTFKGKVDGARRSIRGMYERFQQEVNAFAKHQQDLQWLFAQLAEATFQLLVGEGAVRCVKATWVQGTKEDRDDPQGILFLTDQRLLFEQKQEVATKRVLFITTQKQKVQKLLLTIPVADVENAVASKQGFLSHEDHLTITVTRQSSEQGAHFHLDGQDCNLWQGLVGRAKAHDLEQERVASSPAESVPLPVIPEKCPGCGAAFTQPTTRGMTSIACPFCGRLVRL